MYIACKDERTVKVDKIFELKLDAQMYTTETQENARNHVSGKVKRL